MKRCRVCKREKPDELMSKCYGKIQTICQACRSEQSHKRGHRLEAGEDAPAPALPQGRPPAWRVECDPGPFETSLPRGAIFYAQEFRDLVSLGYLNDGLIAARYDGARVIVHGCKAVEL